MRVSPTSVLFACNYNAVRSPMAEALMKKFYGERIYVQSVGVRHDFDIDGFAVAVLDEMGVALERHNVRSFDELKSHGEEVDSFDLIIALTDQAHDAVCELTRHTSNEIEFWDITNPTDLGGQKREEKLTAYRIARDEIIAKLHDTFGAPDAQ